MAKERVGTTHALHTCGECIHAKIGPETKGDLTQRICYAVPPIPVAIPIGPGQLQIRSMRPPVAIGDAACDCLFESRKTVLTESSASDGTG